jgi:hypothetical protein
MRFRGAEYVGAELADDGWVGVEDPRLPRPIMIRLDSKDGRRLICTGLRIDSNPDQELTARDLRDIPLAEILTQARRRAKTGGYRPAAKVVNTQRARPGRQGYPDEHYHDIARRYRRAVRQKPRAPIRLLMDELRVSEPTVHRWLRGARKLGFLKGGKQ